jgi:hypothetical protein
VAVADAYEWVARLALWTVCSQGLHTPQGRWLKGEPSEVAVPPNQVAFKYVPDAIKGQLKVDW